MTMRPLMALLALLPISLPGSLAAQERPDGARVDSSVVRALQSATRRVPVIVEFAVPNAADAAPDLPGAGPAGSVERLRSRAALALRAREEAMPTGDPDVRVIEDYWIVPAVHAEINRAALDRLAASPSVRRIVSDEPLEVSLDPVSGSVAPPSYTSDAMRTIGADAVWDGGATGEGTVIAFFDSGVDAGNAMVGRRWRGLRTGIRASWFDPFRRSSTPQDLIGHGTQVAVSAVGALSAGDTLQFADGSTLVASTDIDVVTGPAPRAEWIAARVFDSFGGVTYSRRSVLLQAFQWALDPDGNPSTDDAPDIINNSWGILPTEDFDLCTDVLYDAIDAAEAAGIAVLFSAGNTGPAAGSIAFPAARSDPGLRNFAVGSTSGTTTIAVADFSGRGPTPCGSVVKPEIVAPGTVPQVRTVGPGRARLTGFTVQGTSFSVAQASGALALLRQARPGIGPAALKQFLIDAADDVGAPGPDPDAGFGLLDVPGALGAAGSSVIAPRLQVVAAGFDAERLTIELRNRGTLSWDGGAIQVAVADELLARATVPPLAPGHSIAATLAWRGTPPAGRAAVRVVVTSADGRRVLDRPVLLDPPDGFGGFVLADGSTAVGANDFGRLGRISALQGFAWEGADYLTAGGLAVAAGGRVSDGWYVSTLGRPDLKRFAPAAETDWAPSRNRTDVAPSSASVRFDDFEALDPVGVEVDGRYTTSEVDGVGALELQLDVANRNSQALSDLVVGILADWDFTGGEEIQWVAADRALVTQGAGGSGPVAVLAADTTEIARVELPLGTSDGTFYIAGSGVLADSLDEAVKLDLLAGGPGSGLPGAGSAEDNAALLGVGPLAVSAGSSVRVRLWLLVAGDQESALQRLADLRAASPGPGPAPDPGFAALPPYPNPMRTGGVPAKIPYTLSEAQSDAGGTVRLEVYDLAGRLLATSSRPVGASASVDEFSWDGVLSGGATASAGTYLYVIRVGDEAVSGRLLLTR